MDPTALLIFLDPTLNKKTKLARLKTNLDENAFRQVEKFMHQEGTKGRERNAFSPSSYEDDEDSGSPDSNEEGVIRRTFRARGDCRDRHGQHAKVKGWNAKEAQDALAQITVVNNDAQQKESVIAEESTTPIEETPLQPLNLLLVGVECVGKTTLINSLANYVRFNTLEEAKLQELEIIAANKYNISTNDDDYVVEMTPTTGAAADDLEEPPALYSFNAVANGQPRNIQVIDTMGISECGGLTESLDHVDAVVDAVKKIGGLHGILLVIGASTDRIPLNFLPVVRKLFSSFHHDIQRNVMFCFTRSGPIFKPESVYRAVKALIQNLQISDDVSLQFIPRYTFCFDNSGFTQLYAAKKLRKEELIQINAAEYWVKSCAEAKRLLQVVAEQPLFDCTRVRAPPAPPSVVIDNVNNNLSSQKIDSPTIEEQTEALQIEDITITPDIEEELPFIKGLPDLDKKLVLGLLRTGKYTKEEKYGVIKKIIGDERFRLLCPDVETEPDEPSSSPPNDEKKSEDTPSSPPSDEKKLDDPPLSPPIDEKKSDDTPSSLLSDEKKADEPSSSAPNDEKKSEDTPSSPPSDEKKLDNPPPSPPNDEKKSDDPPSSLPPSSSEDESANPAPPQTPPPSTSNKVSEESKLAKETREHELTEKVTPSKKQQKKGKKGKRREEIKEEKEQKEEEKSQSSPWKCSMM